MLTGHKKNTNTRMENLLQSLCLADRRVASFEEAEKLGDINYGPVYEIKAKRTEESKVFLQSAILGDVTK